MEIGNEISNKIRSAIKAKLVELGAYVDEELPDYIMVMVANKKSQFQMSEDLGLFLGVNTEKFTTWLHGLLQRLQSITSDTTAAALSKIEKVAEKSKLKEQTAAKESNSKSKKPISDDSKKHIQDDSKSKKLAVDEAGEIKKDGKRQKADEEKKLSAESDTKIKQPATETDMKTDGTVMNLGKTQYVTPQVEVSCKDANIAREKCIESKDSVTDAKTDKIEVPETKETTETTFDSDIQVVEEDDLSELLLTENDELTEELEQETIVIATNKKSDFTKPASTRVSEDEVKIKPKRGTASITVSKSSLEDDSSLRSSRPKAVTSPIRHSAFIGKVEPRPSQLQSRKRRAPVSVIGAVSHDSDDDEGYDPRNPAVGNVASVVKVTARKSSVPPNLQANKSLLLKAMTEAEKSVETQRRVAITPIRPFMREGRERDRDLERHGHDSSSSKECSHPSLRLAQTSLRQAINQPGVSRFAEAPVYIPTRKVQPAPRMDNSSRGIISKSKRQEAQQRAWLDDDQDVIPPKKFTKQDKETSIVNFVIEAERNIGTVSSQSLPQSQPSLVKVKQEPVSPKQNSPNPEPHAKKSRKKRDSAEIDSRVVEYEPEAVASPMAEKSISESGSQGVPVLLEDMDQDEFVLDQDVELMDSSPVYIEEDFRQAMTKDKPKDKTRFVVTLDGVDSDQYEKDIRESKIFEDQMLMEEGQHLELSQLPAVGLQSLPLSKEQLMKMSPPKIQPMNINLKDSDEEGEAMDEDATPLKKAKMTERCKFWPACVNGAACSYHHPTVHCKTFPFCKFGDKCLFIHPNCRYDSKCARPDCPYTHSSRRSIPLFHAPHIIPVYHALPPPPPAVVPPPYSANPPQCKFFPTCNNVNCPFFHPKPCRFGLACKSKGCPFYHPSLPTKDKLTWAASKDTAKATLASAVAAGKGKNIK